MCINWHVTLQRFAWFEIVIVCTFSSSNFIKSNSSIVKNSIISASNFYFFSMVTDFGLRYVILKLTFIASTYNFIHCTSLSLAFILMARTQRISLEHFRLQPLPKFKRKFEFYSTCLLLWLLYGAILFHSKSRTPIYFIQTGPPVIFFF